MNKELIDVIKQYNIKNIMTDSRVISDKAIFFCIKGLTNDGHNFVSQAISNGAICIVYSTDLSFYENNIKYIKVDDTLKELNEFVSYFYDDVTKKMKIYGVTGTNGKSTTTWLTRYLVNNFIKCGYMGTIGLLLDDELLSSPLTTPDSVFIHKSCKEMFDKGYKALSMEVSSIGLEEHRVDTVDFNAVGFTNLTHDHLDYHHDFESYYQAKKKLFTMISNDAKAVINIDDEYGRRLFDELDCNKHTYGIDLDADYRAVDIELYSDHSAFTLLHKDEKYLVKTNLVAKFNIYNILCAIAMLHEDGYELEKLLPLLENVPQVLGRMETINLGQNFTVIVDYAHTPDGFEKVFNYASSITNKNNQIVSVFGSAGKRDAKKRPVLGKIASEYCVIIILTAEDYRNEDPSEIARQIRDGINNDAKVQYIEDRYTAIEYGINCCNDGDTLLILGKGDEDYQATTNGKEYYMGDQRAAKEIISKMLGVENVD